MVSTKAGGGRSWLMMKTILQKNPRVYPLPPFPGRKSLKFPKPTPKIIRKNPRSIPRNLKHIYPRPYRVNRRPTGAKITEKADLSPKKPRSIQPPPPLPSALPFPAGNAPDRSDLKLFRCLPRYLHHLHTLPDWMHTGSDAGVVAAGRAMAAATEDSAGTEAFNCAPVERL